MSLILKLSSPSLIGVVHLRPLPGSPRYSGSMAEIIDRAVGDAQAYRSGGVDAVIVENFGDAPFTAGRVEPGTVAAMARAGAAVVDVLAGSGIAVGFNVLRNDPQAALGLCAAVGGAFIRVNVHCGAMVTDQGVIEGDAFNTIRKRDQIAPDAAVLADVHVKHASPLGAGIPDIRTAAQDTLKRGLADGLIVSGAGTGAPADPGDLIAVREACPDAAIFVGSGVTAESAKSLLEAASGLIVGTAAKRNGDLAEPVDPDRVLAIRQQMAR